VTKLAGRSYSYVMNSVSEIIEAVKQLDLREKGEFLQRLTEVDFEDAWDRQIEADAKTGRLDPLWRAALEDIKKKNVKPLDDVLNNT
jgi:hypothetical protein